MKYDFYMKDGKPIGLLRDQFYEIISHIKNVSNMLYDMADGHNVEDKDYKDIIFMENIEDIKKSLDALNDFLNNFIPHDKSKGLYPDEVSELMKYIQENNSWENMYNSVFEKNRVVPKYYELTVDTRTGTAWAVKFRQCVNGDKDEITLRTEKGYLLKDKIYEFLDKEIKE